MRVPMCPSDLGVLSCQHDSESIWKLSEQLHKLEEEVKGNDLLAVWFKESPLGIRIQLVQRCR
jgi:hypothetical protein